MSSCLACKKALKPDDTYFWDPYGAVYCSAQCQEKGKKCAGCGKPMDGETSMWRKNGKLYCSEGCL